MQKCLSPTYKKKKPIEISVSTGLNKKPKLNGKGFFVLFLNIRVYH